MNPSEATNCWARSYRQGVQEDSEEEPHDNQEDQHDEEASEAAPHDELHRLAGAGEPEERGVWPTGGGSIHSLFRMTVNYERTLNSLYTDEMMENVKGFIHVITGRRSWSAGHWGSNLKPFGWPILPAGLFTAGWEHVCREAPLLTWGVLVWGSCWAHPGPFQPVSHLHPHHPRSPASSPPCPDAHTHKHTHHIRA